MHVSVHSLVQSCTHSITTSHTAHAQWEAAGHVTAQSQPHDQLHMCKSVSGPACNQGGHYFKRENIYSGQAIQGHVVMREPAKTIPSKYNFMDKLSTL